MANGEKERKPRVGAEPFGAALSEPARGAETRPRAPVATEPAVPLPPQEQLLRRRREMLTTPIAAGAEKPGVDFAPYNVWAAALAEPRPVEHVYSRSAMIQAPPRPGTEPTKVAAKPGTFSRVGGAGLPTIAAAPTTPPPAKPKETGNVTADLINLGIYGRKLQAYNAQKTEAQKTALQQARFGVERKEAESLIGSREAAARTAHLRAKPRPDDFNTPEEYRAAEREWRRAAPSGLELGPEAPTEETPKESFRSYLT